MRPQIIAKIQDCLDNILGLSDASSFEHQFVNSIKELLQNFIDLRSISRIEQVDMVHLDLEELPPSENALEALRIKISAIRQHRLQRITEKK